MTDKKRVSLSVETNDQEILTRATETLARTAVGLTLDGCEVFISLGEGLGDDEG